jgi:hypothetical protein
VNNGGAAHDLGTASSPYPGGLNGYGLPPALSAATVVDGALDPASAHSTKLSIGTQAKAGLAASVDPSLGVPFVKVGPTGSGSTSAALGGILTEVTDASPALPHTGLDLGAVTSGKVDTSGLGVAVGTSGPPISASTKVPGASLAASVDPSLSLPFVNVGPTGSGRTSAAQGGLLTEATDASLALPHTGLDLGAVTSGKVDTSGLGVAVGTSGPPINASTKVPGASLGATLGASVGTLARTGSAEVSSVGAKSRLNVGVGADVGAGVGAGVVTGLSGSVGKS